MPTYERWKYCGQIIKVNKKDRRKDKRCGKIATNECCGGCYHSDDMDGWAKPQFDKATHPRFLCDECFEKRNNAPIAQR